VYADATVETDPQLVVDVMMAVGERMMGQPLADDARPAVEAMAERERRVVLRCRPYETFATPPRQVDADTGDEGVTHWVSGSIPWNAPDGT
jgi:hypothetical protein